MFWGWVSVVLVMFQVITDSATLESEENDGSHASMECGGDSDDMLTNAGDGKKAKAKAKPSGSSGHVHRASSATPAVVRSSGMKRNADSLAKEAESQDAQATLPARNGMTCEELETRNNL